MSLLGEVGDLVIALNESFCQDCHEDTFVVVVVVIVVIVVVVITVDVVLVAVVVCSEN